MSPDQDDAKVCSLPIPNNTVLSATVPLMPQGVVPSVPVTAQLVSISPNVQRGVRRLRERGVHVGGLVGLAEIPQPVFKNSAGIMSYVVAGFSRRWCTLSPCSSIEKSVHV